VWLAIAVWVAFRPSVLAHETPADRPISAFVKVDAEHLELLLRIPLDILSPQLPTTSGQIDVEASTSVLDDAVTRVSEAIALFEGTQPLAPGPRAYRLSLPSDRSFDRYATASARLESAIVESPIYANQGYLDARLTYPIKSSASMISVESRVTDRWGSAPKLSLAFLPNDGSERRYSISGELGRVALNPTLYEAVRRFFLVGLTLVLWTAEYLLLLVSVIIPLRSRRDVAPVAFAVVCGYAGATVAAALTLVRVDSPFAQVAGASAAIAVTAAALLNLVAPSLPRRWVFGGMAGILCGFASARAVQEQLPFSGAYPLVSTIALSAGTTLGQLVAASLVTGAALLWVHRSAHARARILVVSAIVADVGWHWSTERAAPLWQAGWAYSGSALLVLTRSLAAVVLVGIVAQYVVRAFRQHAPAAVKGASA
jgi:hypothetical protein